MKRPPEMSAHAFKAALKRRGFVQTLYWVRDTTGQVPRVSWGMILHCNGKPAYRATLAHVIRERERSVAAAPRKI